MDLEKMIENNWTPKTRDELEAFLDKYDLKDALMEGIEDECFNELEKLTKLQDHMLSFSVVADVIDRNRDEGNFNWFKIVQVLDLSSNDKSYFAFPNLYNSWDSFSWDFRHCVPVQQEEFVGTRWVATNKSDKPLQITVRT